MDNNSRRRAEVEKEVGEERLRRNLRRFDYWLRKSDSHLVAFKFVLLLVAILFISGVGAALAGLVAFATSQTFDQVWSHGGRLLTIIIVLILLVVELVRAVRSTALRK
jgi:hypothetical protein